MASRTGPVVRRCLGRSDILRPHARNVSGECGSAMSTLSARLVRRHHSLATSSWGQNSVRGEKCSGVSSRLLASRRTEYRLFSAGGRLKDAGKDEEFRRDTGQVPRNPKTATTTTESTPPLPEALAAAKQKVLSSLPKLTPHENIYNLPNILTVSRLFAAPATAYLLLHDHNTWALALFAYAGITDLVDGWIARRWKLQTVAGSVIDPMADKALMIILTVTLAVKGALPLSLATLILGRDASLALAAIYYRYASLPHPKTLLRYWDFSLPSAEVHPTTVSKYNTFLQLILIGSTLTLPLVTSGGAYAHLLGDVVGDDALRTAMTAFQCVVAGTTAWSGLSYAWLKRAVTILGEDEALKAKQGARGRAIIGVTFGSVVAGALWIAVFKDGEKEAVESEVD